MRRIKKIGVVQTAKVAAVIYFFMSFVFIAPLFAFMSAFGNAGPFSELPISPAVIFLIVPFFYAAIVFVFTAIGCAVYNLVSHWVGGIEVEIEEVEA